MAMCIQLCFWIAKCCDVIISIEFLYPLVLSLHPQQESFFVVSLKINIDNLAIFSGKPAFARQLHIRRPNICDLSSFLKRIEEILDNFCRHSKNCYPERGEGSRVSVGYHTYEILRQKPQDRFIRETRQNLDRHWLYSLSSCVII